MVVTPCMLKTKRGKVGQDLHTAEELERSQFHSIAFGSQLLESEGSDKMLLTKKEVYNVL